jgi:hypothetical protein
VGEPRKRKKERREKRTRAESKTERCGKAKSKKFKSKNNSKSEIIQKSKNNSKIQKIIQNRRKHQSETLTENQSVTGTSPLKARNRERLLSTSIEIGGPKADEGRQRIALHAIKRDSQLVENRRLGILVIDRFR